MSKRTVCVIIRGRVQGVFFRASAKEQADRLGITGWIRNEPDGTITLEVCGDAEGMDHFLQWCNRGPASARVEHVEIKNAPNACPFEDFRILR